MEVEYRRGFWWPASDRHAGDAVIGTAQDMNLALEHVRGDRLCIQAGGNVGVWAEALSYQFDEVWTFEPDLENYLCLLRNVPHNVNPFLAALGEAPDWLSLDRVRDNCGAHRISRKPGRVPVLTIDELELPACDLIILDIEGFEPQALAGAARTIARFKPVLMVEDKNLCHHYGVESGWTEHFKGYRVVAKVHSDIILVPE